MQRGELATYNWVLLGNCMTVLLALLLNVAIKTICQQLVAQSVVSLNKTCYRCAPAKCHSHLFAASTLVCCVTVAMYLTLSVWNAVVNGEQSQLLGDIHIALLKLLQADMEEAYATGAIQVCCSHPGLFSPSFHLILCQFWTQPDIALISYDLLQHLS